MRRAINNVTQSNTTRVKQQLPRSPETLRPISPKKIPLNSSINVQSLKYNHESQVVKYSTHNEPDIRIQTQIQNSTLLSNRDHRLSVSPRRNNSIVKNAAGQLVITGPPAFQTIRQLGTSQVSVRSQSAIRLQQVIMQPVVHRIEQPLQVVDLRQIEELWNEKVARLEQKLKEDHIDTTNPTETEELGKVKQVLQQKIDLNTELQHSLQESHQEIKKQAKVIEEIKNENQEIQKHYQSQIEQMQRLLQETTKANQELQFQVQEKVQQVTAIEQQLHTVKKEKSIITQEKIQQQQKLQPLEQLATQLQQQNQTLDREVLNLKGDIARTQRQVKDLQATSNAMEINTQELKTEKARLMTMVNDLEHNLQQQIQLLEGQTSDNRDLRAQINYFKSQLEEKDAIIEELENEIDEIGASNEEHSQTTSHVMGNEITQWKNKYKELTNAYHELQEKLMLAEAQLEILQKKQERNSEKRKVLIMVFQSMIDSQRSSEYERPSVDKDEGERLRKQL